jgi:uncharacterized protein with NRDE domain
MYDWSDPVCPFIVCNNRDERVDRPTARGAIREGNCYYPLDEEAGGTWIAFSSVNKRFAVVLNFHDFRYPDLRRNDHCVSSGQKLSRGKLPLDFIHAPPAITAECFCNSISMSSYNGFSLVVGDESGCFIVSNFDRTGPKALEPGVLHGISNGKLTERWEKIEVSVEKIAKIIPELKDASISENRGELTRVCRELVTEMQDRTALTDPTTGELSAYICVPFATGNRDICFGTRTTTVAVIVKVDGKSVCEPISSRQQPSELLFVTEYDYENDSKTWKYNDTLLSML